MDSKLICIFDLYDDIIMEDEKFKVELHPGSVNYTDTKEQILEIHPAHELHFKGMSIFFVKTYIHIINS